MNKLISKQTCKQGSFDLTEATKEAKLALLSILLLLLPSPKDPTLSSAHLLLFTHSPSFS